MYKITLNDGTVLDNMELNGNNFVTEKDLDGDLFSEDNLSKVTIESEDGKETYINAVLVAFQKYDNKTWIILREQTEEERKEAEINAKLEYLAMMGGIEL